ncbi:MAG: SgcJ/EcaC family oxidoreductase [Planctomycetia bacterium]
MITKPKPFRLPDVVGPVLTLEPVTMQSRMPVVTTQPRSSSHPANVAPAPAALAVAAATPAPPAVAEVGAMLRDYLQAFNRHDSTALAAHWSTSGENVDLDSGVTTRGREAVERVFATLFEEDAAAKIDIDVESIRPLRDDVAVVDGVTQISFSDEATPLGDRPADSSPASTRFSAVVVKQDGRWMLESVRETAVPAATRPRHSLDDLDWLVGSWEDLGEGVTAGTHCFWSAGKAFLVRSHVVTFDSPGANPPAAGVASIPGLLSAGTGTSREITEIIGWDPERQQVRSWLFTSDGRFAEGWWTRDGDRWSVRLEGRGADESATCTFALERVGPDGLSIRRTGDALADVMPPACEFVRTARLGSDTP